MDNGLLVGSFVSYNKTPAEAFTPPAEKKIGTKWALCTTAQAGNIKSGYLRILLYIAVVLCLVIGQLHWSMTGSVIC